MIIKNCTINLYLPKSDDSRSKHERSECAEIYDPILIALQKGYGLPPLGEENKVKRDIWFMKCGILPPLEDDYELTKERRP
jgi:hypothetical protein